MSHHIRYETADGGGNPFQIEKHEHYIDIFVEDGTEHEYKKVKPPFEIHLFRLYGNKIYGGAPRNDPMFEDTVGRAFLVEETPRVYWFVQAFSVLRLYVDEPIIDFLDPVTQQHGDCTVFLATKNYVYILYGGDTNIEMIERKDYPDFPMYPNPLLTKEIKGWDSILDPYALKTVPSRGITAHLMFQLVDPWSMTIKPLAPDFGMLPENQDILIHYMHHVIDPWKQPIKYQLDPHLLPLDFCSIKSLPPIREIKHNFQLFGDYKLSVFPMENKIILDGELSNDTELMLRTPHFWIFRSQVPNPNDANVSVWRFWILSRHGVTMWPDLPIAKELDFVYSAKKHTAFVCHRLEQINDPKGVGHRIMTYSVRWSSKRNQFMFAHKEYPSVNALSYRELRYGDQSPSQSKKSK